MRKLTSVSLLLIPLTAVAAPDTSVEVAAKSFCKKLDSEAHHLATVHPSLLPGAVKRSAKELGVSEKNIESLASTLRDIVPSKISQLESINSYIGYKSESSKSCEGNYISVMHKKKSSKNAKDGSIFLFEISITRFAMDSALAKEFPGSLP